MPTPTKSADVLRMEGRTHKTKRELSERLEAEASMLTGRPMTEAEIVKKSPVAHETFERVSANLEAIGKNDAMFEACINRYCTMTARLAEMLEEREHMEQLDDPEASKLLLPMDREIRAVEKMLFEIEKDNLMTVQSAARQVPKRPEKKKSPLMEALESGN